MVKASQINKVVDELRESILATVRRQRQFRSGTFWNKFKFERRTKERIESVKAALADRKIEINLEDSFFGTEKRGELIIFRMANGQPPNKDKKKAAHGSPTIKIKEIGDPAFETE